MRQRLRGRHDEEARRLFTSLQQAFINLRRGRPGLLPPPVDPSAGHWSEFEAAGIWQVLRYSAVGSRDTVRRWLRDFIDQTRADELMVTAQIYDPAARLRSFEIVSGVAAAL